MKVLLETATIKAALPETDFDLTALLLRVNMLTEEVANLKKELSSRPKEAQVVAQAPAPAVAPVIEPAPVKTVQPEVKEEPRKSAMPEKRVEEPKPAPEKENQRAYSEEDFGTPPPEEDYLPEGAYIPPVEQAEAKRVEQRAQAPVGNLPKGRLFGALLRALRSNGHVFLWTVCTELKNRETDTELFLYADEAAYPILIREEHVATLKKVLATLSDKTLAIAKGEPQADSFDMDVQKLKNAFGADFVTIK